MPTSHGMPKWLEIEGLSIGNAQKEIVKNISLNLQSGERLGLVGESGSGKSLTALSIAGLLPRGLKVLSGDIHVFLNNKHLQLSSATESTWLDLRRRHIGFVFQEPMSALNPVITCGEQLMENLEMGGLNSVKTRKEQALMWMNEVDLPSPERMFLAYPHELSGGQRQRLMIAMAMCNRPQLLIADEPTTALDVMVRDKVLDLMLRLCEKYGTSLLLISHDLRMVAERCDRIAVMQHGEIVEQNTAKEITQNPNHPYTKALWECRPDPHHRRVPLPTVADVMQGEVKAEYQTLEEWNEIAQLLKVNQPLLKVDDLHFSYGKTPILKGLSFELFPGESLGFVGPSGCGKSTLSRVIAGLEPYTHGSVSFFENNDFFQLNHQHPKWSGARIQMIFQDAMAALNPHLSIGKMLLEVRRHFFPLENSWESNAKVLDVLAEMQLPEDAFYRYPHSFSGGQRQRICIARALLVEPQILICDESVAALDVSVQAHILNLLHRIRQNSGMSFLFISHDPNVVSYFCHRTLHMHEGKFVEDRAY